MHIQQQHIINEWRYVHETRYAFSAILPSRVLSQREKASREKAARIARHVERVPIKAAVDLWYLCSGYLYC